MDFVSGFRGTLIIDQIDVAKRKARGRYTLKGADLLSTVIDGPQVMEFTFGPNPKLLLHTDIPGGT